MTAITIGLIVTAIMVLMLFLGLPLGVTFFFHICPGPGLDRRLSYSSKSVFRWDFYLKCIL